MKPFLVNRPRTDYSPSTQSGSATVLESPVGALHPDVMAAASAVSSTIAHGPVGVEAIKENGRITKLIVSCKCGEQIEILCAYSNEPQGVASR